MNHKDSAQKVYKKVHEKLFYCTEIYVYENFVFFLFHFSRISSSLKRFFKFFMFLFYIIKTN